MTPLVSGRSPSPQEIQRTNRRLLQKLKLSEEALEEKITSEVEELLIKMKTDRQLARLSARPSSK